MFGFFKKNIDLKTIKNIKDVKKVIHFFIDEKQWDLCINLLENAQKFEHKNYEQKLEIAVEKKDKEGVKKGYSKNLNIIQELFQLVEGEKKRYEVVADEVKSFTDIIKAIKIYAKISEWEKAYELISEVKKVEKQGLKILLEHIDEDITHNKNTEKEQKKQMIILKKKEVQLNKLLLKIQKDEYKYKEKQRVKKFKEHFKQIKSKIYNLSQTGKNPEALKLLQIFLDDNKESAGAIHFYNKEKGKILKNIEIQRKKTEKNTQMNIREQALKLSGQTINIDMSKGTLNNKKEKITFLGKIKEKLNFYRKIQAKIEKKKLIDEVTLLIEADEHVNKQITEQKLQSIHQGLIKEISPKNVEGYNIYGKILGADKISGDTFGFFQGKENYRFFLGDATGHGIRAGLIVTLFTRLFNKFVSNKTLIELAFEINNGLKQDLKSRNFITGILFELDKLDINTMNYIGMGHEPMFLYRKNTNTIEKLIPGGLGAGIRLIKKQESIKVKQIQLFDGDILLTYSDGIVESKGIHGEFYGFERLKKTFWGLIQTEVELKIIYQKLLDDLILFRGGAGFDDDVTILMLKRDSEQDIQKEGSDTIKTLSKKQNLSHKEQKRLIGKSKEEINTELKNIRTERSLNIIIKDLKLLYQTGEFLQLKQTAIKNIKEGWIHKDINFYLKKALENETTYKIDQKNKKILNRYTLLNELLKKGDYDTVIQELEIIISKNGAI